MSRELKNEKVNQGQKSQSLPLKKKGKGWDNKYKIEKGLSIGTRQDQQSGIYYARLYMDGRDKVYSLNTTDKTDAIVKAAKLKQNIDINGKEVVVKRKRSGKKRVLIHTKWSAFLDYKRGLVDSGEIQPERLQVYHTVDRNWFGKYVRRNKYDFEQVNEQWVIDFWNWRRNYVGSDEHKRDARNARKNGEKFQIKNKTKGYGLDNERKIIKEFLTWAFRMGHTQKAVPMQLDRKPEAIGDSAEGFTLEEYYKLQKNFDEWIKSSQNDDIRNTRIRVFWKFKLMLACGVRTADLIQLKWKDIVPLYDAHTSKWKGYFWAKAKGKKRPAPITELMYSELISYREKCKYNKDDDFVFSTQSGKSSSTDNDKWKAYLKENDCLYDRNGKSRNTTSLRHTFATFSILYTNEKLDHIARRMGTSIRQIEEHYADEVRLRESEKFTTEVVPKMGEFDTIRQFLNSSHNGKIATDMTEEELGEYVDEWVNFIGGSSEAALKKIQKYKDKD